jgi:hypothetical protein
MGKNTSHDTILIEDNLDRELNKRINLPNKDMRLRLALLYLLLLALKRILDKISYEWKLYWILEQISYDCENVTVGTCRDRDGTVSK